MTLALRLITLVETEVQRGLEYTPETIAGLYEGQPTSSTDRPTGKWILQSFARAQLTLTHTKMRAVTLSRLTPLAPLQEQLLWQLRFPASLSTALAHNSS